MLIMWPPQPMSFICRKERKVEKVHGLLHGRIKASVISGSSILMPIPILSLNLYMHQVQENDSGDIPISQPPFYILFPTMTAHHEYGGTLNKMDCSM